MVDLKEVKSLIRSMLISSPRSLTIRQLNFDFRSQEGYDIPFRQLGYGDLIEFLNTIPDTVKLFEDPISREVVVLPVQNEKTQHVDELVTKQRISKPKSLAKPKYVPPFRRRGHSSFSAGHRTHTSGSATSRVHASANAAHRSHMLSNTAHRQNLKPPPQRPFQSRQLHSPPPVKPPQRSERDNFIEQKAAYIKSLQDEVLKRIQENPNGFPLHEIQDEFITNRPMYQKYVSNVEDFMNVSKDLFRSVRGMVYLASCYSDTPNTSSSVPVQEKFVSAGMREGSHNSDIKPLMLTNVKPPFSSKFRNDVPPRFQPTKIQDYTFESRNKDSLTNQTHNNTVLAHCDNSSNTLEMNNIVDHNKYDLGFSHNVPNTVHNNSNCITDDSVTQKLAKAMDKYIYVDRDNHLPESDSERFSVPQFNKKPSSIKSSDQEFVKNVAEEISSKSSDQLASKFNSYMNHYDAVFRKADPNIQEGTTPMNNSDKAYKPNVVHGLDTKYGQNNFNYNRESRLFTESPDLSPPSNMIYNSSPTESNISHHLGDFHIDEDNHFDKSSGRISRNSVCSQSSSEKTSLSVGNKMESNLIYLIHKNSNGILASELQRKYKEQFEVDLDYRSYGCASVIHFASSLPHIFICRKHDSTDWILFGATNTKARLSGVSADYVQPIVPEDIVEKIGQLTIKQPGMTLRTLEKQYEKKYGTHISFEKYGFSDLESMLVSLTERHVRLYYIHDECYVYRKARDMDSPSALPHSSRINKVDIELHEEILRCYPEDVFGLPNALSTQDLPDTCTDEPFTVQLAEVFNPGKFYYQLNDNYDALDDMMNEMQVCYSSSRSEYKMHPRTVVPSQYCATLYKDESSVVEWTRAKITKIISRDMVEVFFIDYGTVSKVRVDDLCYLRNKFAQLPCQARRGSVAGIKPKYDKWANHSGHVLLNLVTGRPVMAIVHKIKQSSYQSFNIDYLSLFETSGKTDIDIGKYLVQEGVALPLSEEEEEDELESPQKKEKITGYSKIETFEQTTSLYEPQVSKVKVTTVPPGFTPKTSNFAEKQYSFMDTTAPSQYMASTASSQFMTSTPLTSSQFMSSTAPPPGFMASYPNSMQTSGYANYLGSSLIKPSAMTDPLMLAQVANPYLAAAALQYQQYQYWVAQQMYMATALNSLNMPRPPETAVKLTEVDTHCTFSTQTCPSPIETASTRRFNDEPKATLNTKESDYSNIMNPTVTRMTKGYGSDSIKDRPSDSLRYEHKDVSSSKSKSLHRKAEAQKVKCSEEKNQDRKDETAVQRRIQSPKMKERHVGDVKVNKEKLQEIIERRDVPPKVAESERIERRQQKNIKLPLPPVKNVDIGGTVYHIVWAVDRYYMCTLEIAQHMCNFSGVHVLIKLLESFGDDIPFLTVNKTNHDRVYQALLSSDMVELKKKDMMQSFHLTPLKDVPKIMNRLNLLHNKLKLGLEGAIEALSS